MMQTDPENKKIFIDKPEKFNKINQWYGTQRSVMQNLNYIIQDATY